MKYCKNCFMPDTKPGIVLNEDGVCQACVRAAEKKNIDYDQRFEELKILCNKYRSSDGYYDCIIPSSGGKDSHFAVYVMKKLMNMNPLIVTVCDPFKHTQAGAHNFLNVGDAFSCDTVAYHMNPNMVRKIGRYMFEKYGCPTWPIDRAIYTFPIQEALKRNIQLVIYGENTNWEYGGVQNPTEEPYSAKEQIYNDIVKSINFKEFQSVGIDESDLNMLVNPTIQQIETLKIEPIYLSYFIKWNGDENYQIAQKYGFKDVRNEWQRLGFIEHYDQIDSYAYMVHPWLKYPKFGFERATDVVGYWIRSGKITREEGLKLLKENENNTVDPKALEDFLDYFGYTHEEFWNIVEKFWNRDIFEKQGGLWKKKIPNVWDIYN